MNPFRARRCRWFFAPLIPAAVLATVAPRVARANGHALDLSEATIAELQAAMRKRALTSEKLVSRYLARIAAHDPAAPLYPLRHFHVNRSPIDPDPSLP